MQALLSVFKGRVSDFKDKDNAIERCEAEFHDSVNETQCRFIVQMICRHGKDPRLLSAPTLPKHVLTAVGVVKTYKLTYEAVTIQHALFDRATTQNQWAIDSRLLREIIEYFGTTAELLDLSSENGRALFTSSTTKATSGKGVRETSVSGVVFYDTFFAEILKQPVHTSVAIDTKDFGEFMVEEKLHVAISAKDFKAIVTHADTLKALNVMGQVLFRQHKYAETEPLYGNEQARYDVSKFGWLGSLNRDVATCIAWARSGVKSTEDARRRVLHSPSCTPFVTRSVSLLAVRLNPTVALHTAPRKRSG